MKLTWLQNFITNITWSHTYYLLWIFLPLLSCSIKDSQGKQQNFSISDTFTLHCFKNSREQLTILRSDYRTTQQFFLFYPFAAKKPKNVENKHDSGAQCIKTKQNQKNKTNPTFSLSYTHTVLHEIFVMSNSFLQWIMPCSIFCYYDYWIFLFVSYTHHVV